MSFKETEVVTLADKKFLVHHIVNPRALADPMKARIRRDRPDAVVFGHTHKKFAEMVDGVFYFNPGYAGKPKFGAERSVALLHLDGPDLRHEFIPL
jgi:putative phosphoesterase